VLEQPHAKHSRLREAVAVDSVCPYNEDGNLVRNTTAIGHLGGATLDNEENYLIKKLLNNLGIISIENQARI